MRMDRGIGSICGFRLDFPPWIRRFGRETFRLSSEASSSRFDPTSISWRFYEKYTKCIPHEPLKTWRKLVFSLLIYNEIMSGWVTVLIMRLNTTLRIFNSKPAVSVLLRAALMQSRRCKQGCFGGEYTIKSPPQIWPGCLWLLQSSLPIFTAITLYLFGALITSGGKLCLLSITQTDSVYHCSLA